MKIERKELVRFAQSSELIRAMVVMAASAGIGITLGAEMCKSQIVPFDDIALLVCLFIGVAVSFLVLLERRELTNQRDDASRTAEEPLAPKATTKPNSPTWQD